ncbi:MAG: flippase-like domain-containing protein [Candidatus Zixiibacteriota bacterium]|nr:MAG: flippase-like domain-containing protein [candidate division Zixibacteria bacterium]
MPGFLKKKQFWGSIIALLLLAFILKDIRYEDIRALADRVNLYFLIPCLMAQFLILLFKGWRWRTIIERIKRIKLRRAIPLFAAGQVINIFMPALTGQVGRLLLFARKEELSKTFVFSTIVLEVLFDAMSLLLFIVVLSAASFVFPPEYRQVGFIIAIATVSLLIFLYLFLHFQDAFGSFGRRVFRGRWPGFYITVKKFSRSFTRGITMLRSTQYFFKTLSLSVAAWVSQLLVVYSLFQAFGFDLPLVAAMVLMVVNTLAIMVPITPGNAGTFELAVLATLSLFFRGIGKTDAALFGLALHIFDIIPMFVMGYFFLHIEKMTIKEIDVEEAEQEKEGIMDRMEAGEMVAEEDKV